CPHGGTLPAALNRAAATANAETLLFLRPGIMPEQSNWLRRMWEYYHDRPNLSAISPCLLDASGMIDFALPQLQVTPETGLRFKHSWRGHAGSHAPARTNAPAQALPFACFMVRSDRFQEAGGFPVDFAFEDHSAAALCLTLTKLHGQNMYFGEMALYSLAA